MFLLFLLLSLSIPFLSIPSLSIPSLYSVLISLPFLMDLLRTLYYQAHKVIRDGSRFVVGTFFEPERDIVLITGGSGGLGSEIVSQFAAKGAIVVVADIKPPENPIGGVQYYETDVSNADLVLKLRDTIRSDVGLVTVLVNNAATVCGKTLLELTPTEIQTTINVNLLSSFYTIKAFLPDMLSQKRGYVVTVALILGYLSPARLSAYGALKLGLIALHELITYELRPPITYNLGVKTLLICPGQMKTDMFTGVNTPSSFFAPELDPRMVAKKIVNALELGRRGEIKLPLYGKFLPVVRAVPWPLVQVIRQVSGIDTLMKTFRKVSEIGSALLHSS